MKQIVRTVGLDLAKNSFYVHCADADGRCVEAKALGRSQVLPYFERLPSCKVAMETCTGANFWCRQLQEQGHDARLIPAKFVKPFVKSQKNDALDAEAICEAAQRPSMRYAPLKSEESSAVLTMHRTRRRFVKQRTMCINGVRSACAEFGLVAPRTTKGYWTLETQLRDDDSNDLPKTLKASQLSVLDIIASLTDEIDKLSDRIKDWHKANEASRRLAEMPGVGVLGASYLTAVLGDGSAYDNGRQFAASLGLVPRQTSTGGRERLGGITKSGDPHLRTLLFEGAMALINARLRSGNGNSYPATARKVHEKSRQVVATAIANRNARCAWAMIAHGTKYDVTHRPPRLCND